MLANSSPGNSRGLAPGKQRARGRWRRFFRLSLRTLLLVLVLLGVWLGVTFNRVREQRAAVARIQQLGGSVQYAHDLDAIRRKIKKPVLPGPAWLRRLLGPEIFQDVVWIRLSNTAVTDADLRLVGKLRSVAQLELSFTNVSDAGLYELRRCRRLKWLDLNETKVTSDGLRHLAAMPDLAGLMLSRTEVGDEGMACLSSHRQLAHLGLEETRVTSKGIEHLRGCSALSDLFLSNTSVDDAAVETLSSLRNLTSLILTRKMSGAGVLAVSDALPGCRVEGHLVDLGGRPDKKLSRTTAQWAPVLTRIVALDGEDRLKVVDLKWCNIQDEHLAALHGLKNVELIDLRDSDVTSAGASALRAALPHCDVRH
jgi:hypothetical protein